MTMAFLFPYSTIHDGHKEINISTLSQIKEGLENVERGFLETIDEGTPLEDWF